MTSLSQITIYHLSMQKNLHGWAMMQPLPVSGLQSAKPELKEFLETPDNAPEG